MGSPDSGAIWSAFVRRRSWLLFFGVRLIRAANSKSARDYTGLDNNDTTISEVESKQSLAQEWANLFSGNFFYSSIEDEELLDNGVLSSNKFLEKMQDNVAQGCKVLIFDNLTTLTLLQVQGKSGWEIVSTFISQLIQFAKQNKIVIIYVIHTKEGVIYTETPEGIKTLIENDKADQIFKESITINKRPTTSDILGGTAAHSQLGGTFLLWRPYQDLKLSHIQEMTELILADFRHAPSGDPILLSFRGDKGTFIEAEQNTSQAAAPSEENHNAITPASENEPDTTSVIPDSYVYSEETESPSEENNFAFEELI